jgi:hypothetical protein
MESYPTTNNTKKRSHCSVDFNDDSGPGWFDEPDYNDFRVTDDSKKFLFGKGKFPYIQWNLRDITENSLKTTPSTYRNAVFLVLPNLVVPEESKIIFFKPAIEYEDIWESDFVGEGSKFKTKARDVLRKLKRFDIMPKEPFFVSMDTPLHTGFYTHPTWHQDYFPMIFMSPEFQTEITNAFDKDTLSDYTIIEYTNKCTSTAVKLPEPSYGFAPEPSYGFAPEPSYDFARFPAEQGTAVCVNNKDLKHSSPFIDPLFSEINRTQGDKRVKTAIGRLLYRTQIKRVSEDVAKSMISNNEFIIFKLDLSEVLSDIGSVEPFEEFTLNKYLQERHNKEAGGARKRKIAKNTKKTKRTNRTNHTKRTKSKTRKR